MTKKTNKIIPDPNDLPDENTGTTLLYDPKTGKVKGRRVDGRGVKGQAAIEDFINVDTDKTTFKDAYKKDIVAMLDDVKSLNGGLFVGITNEPMGNHDSSTVCSVIGMEVPNNAIQIAHTVGYLTAKLHIEKLCQYEEYSLCKDAMTALMRAFGDGVTDAIPDQHRKYLADIVKKELEGGGE